MMREQTLSVSTEVIAQEVSGETVLLDLKSEQYFSLDVVGTRIWQLLNEGVAIDQIMFNLSFSNVIFLQQRTLDLIDRNAFIQ